MEDLREFQLYLLSQMRNERFVREALSRVGASHADMRAARQAMTQLGVGGFPPPHADLYRRLLGEPVVLESEAANWPVKDCVPWRFRLPLWPSFDFLLSVDAAAGWGFIEGFARAVDQPSPPLESVAELVPWRFTEKEISEQFTCLENADEWPPMKDLVFEIPEAKGGRLRKYLLKFDYYLLQSVNEHDD